MAATHSGTRPQIVLPQTRASEIWLRSSARASSSRHEPLVSAANSGHFRISGWTFAPGRYLAHRWGLLSSGYLSLGLRCPWRLWRRLWCLWRFGERCLWLVFGSGWSASLLGGQVLPHAGSGLFRRKSLFRRTLAWTCFLDGTLSTATSRSSYFYSHHERLTTKRYWSAASWRARGPPLRLAGLRDTSVGRKSVLSYCRSVWQLREVACDASAASQQVFIPQAKSAAD